MSTAQNPNVAQITTMLLLGGFSNEDLNKLSETIRYARAQLGKEQIRELRVGQTVTWSGKRGPQTGKVTKINIKYVLVTTGQGMTWKVPAAMLTVLA